jgi:hypothetical protein
LKEKIYQYIKVLITIKLLLLVARAFSPFVHPHIIRQTDTMGVSFRYWMRWAIESDAFSKLLPAVLTPGDGVGIQSMEFPIFNLFFAPVFGLGIEWGRPVAQLLNLLVALVLTYTAYKTWKGIRIKGLEVNKAFPLLLVSTTSSIYFYRFIPDYVGFMLVTIAVGFSFDEHKKKPFSSFLLLTTGLLMKPTVAIALGPLLLAGSFKHIIKSILTWIMPALGIAVLYYTKGIKYLRTQSDVPYYFYTEFRNPIIQLRDFFAHPAQIFDLFFTSVFGHWLLIPLLIGWVYKTYQNKKVLFSPLFAVLLLQILAIALLDGEHSFIHDYYFIGLSFMAALITLRFIEDAPKYLLIFYFITLSFINLEKTFYEVRPLFKKTSYQTCANLKLKNPDFPWNKGYDFRSTPGPVPYLGLCFGEKQGSKNAEYGFFYQKQDIPTECQHIDKENEIIIVRCS